MTAAEVKKLKSAVYAQLKRIASRDRALGLGLSKGGEQKVFKALSISGLDAESQADVWKKFCAWYWNN